jgi:hypothetical protein
MALLRALAASVLLAGCYGAPLTECTVQCATDNATCPRDMPTCGADGFCHPKGSTKMCALPDLR